MLHSKLKCECAIINNQEGKIFRKRILNSQVFPEAPVFNKLFLSHLRIVPFGMNMLIYKFAPIYSSVGRQSSAALEP